MYELWPVYAQRQVQLNVGGLGRPGDHMPGGALAQLCNPAAEVSSHYFVFEDGRIVQLVPESRRAWHA